MKKFNSIWLGAIIGVVTAFISIIVLYMIKHGTHGFIEYFKMLMNNRKLLAPVVSIAGIPNLAVFYLFINREKYKTAKGIILATLILAVIVLLIKVL